MLQSEVMDTYHSCPHVASHKDVAIKISITVRFRVIISKSVAYHWDSIAGSIERLL